MKRKLNKLPKWIKDLFHRCQGGCPHCFDDGSCKLQNLIKRHGKEQIIEIVSR